MSLGYVTRARSLVIGASVLSGLTAFIGALTLWRSRDAAVEHADAEARSLAIPIDRNVSTVLDKASLALGAITAQLERQIAVRGIERRWLRNMDSGTTLMPEIAQIGVFDEHGRNVACGSLQGRHCPFRVGMVSVKR